MTTVAGTRALEITSVEVSACELPLAHPVRLGSTVYRNREVVVLRLTDTDGRVGTAIGYTRGTPLVAALTSMVEELLGVSPWRRAAAVSGVRATRLHGANSFVRAISLVDIALHDLAAQAAEVPLYQLLGGLRDRVPVIAVAGYFADTRPLGSIVDEVLGLADDGYRAIKLILLLADLPSDIALLRRVRGELPSDVGLAIDLHGGAASLSDAQRLLAEIEPLNLMFVEDPFGVEARTATNRLAAHSNVAIASGEDAGGLSDLREICEAVHVLRVDATASGGISTAIAAAAMAQTVGVEVIPHVWEHVHAHIAGACGAVAWVERIPTASGADPLDMIGLRPMEMIKGELALSEAPGLGIQLDDDAVAFYRTSHAGSGPEIKDRS